VPSGSALPPGWRARAERAAPWLAAALVLIPFVAFEYVASYDLPCHEEIVAALRNRSDPARYPPGFFVWNLGHPNQLFYLLAYPLAFAVSPHVASTIVLAAAVSLTPLAMARAAAYFGRTRWLALLAAPLALGFPFDLGFVPNVLGLALFLSVLPELDRFAARSSPAGAARIAAVLALLYLAHESAAVFACLGVVAFSLGRPTARRLLAWRALPLALATLGIAAAHVRTSRMMGPNLLALPPFIDLPASQKTDQIPMALLGMHAPDLLTAAFRVIALAFALFAIDGVIRRPRGEPRPPRVWAKLARYRVLALGVALASGYYVSPWGVYGATFLNVRFLAPAAALLVIAVAPRARPGPSPWTCAAAIAAAVATLALTLHATSITSASLHQLDALVPRVAPGSAVAHLNPLGAAPRAYTFSVDGAVTRVTAARGGRAPSSFLEVSTIPPLLIAPAYRWNGAGTRASASGLALLPAYDLRRYRYVIAWLLSADAPADRLTRALAPEARFVARGGGWVLYESTLDVEPLTAPEREAPKGAESVGDRLAKMAKDEAH
jgi:hypothetical protein